MRDVFSQIGGKRPIAAFLVLAAAGCVFFAARSRAETERTTKRLEATPVLTETAETKAFRPTSSYSGFVSGVRQADVAPKTGGYVAKLLVEEGDRVSAGQVVATVDGSELIAMKESASASYAAAREAADEAGDYYDQLVDEAEANHRKVKDAYDDGNVGTRDLRIAEEAVKSAEAARDAQVAAVRAELAQAEGGRLVAEVAAKNATVVAPFSGVVTRRHVSEGAFVAPGMPIFSVASPDSPEMSVSVPGEVARGLSRGDTLAVFPEGDHEPMSGTIASVAQGVGITTQTSVVRIRLIDEEASRSVFLGQYAAVSVPIGPTRETVSVPASAIVREYDDTFVFVLTGEGRAEKRSVTLGESVGDRYELLSGVESGMTIITEGAYGLADGDPVIHE